MTGVSSIAGSSGVIQQGMGFWGGALQPPLILIEPTITGTISSYQGPVMISGEGFSSSESDCYRLDRSIVSTNSSNAPALLHAFSKVIGHQKGPIYSASITSDDFLSPSIMASIASQSSGPMMISNRASNATNQLFYFFDQPAAGYIASSRLASPLSAAAIDQIIGMSVSQYSTLSENMISVKSEQPLSVMDGVISRYTKVFGDEPLKDKCIVVSSSNGVNPYILQKLGATVFTTNLAENSSKNNFFDLLNQHSADLYVGWLDHPDNSFIQLASSVIVGKNGPLSLSEQIANIKRLTGIERVIYEGASGETLVDSKVPLRGKYYFQDELTMSIQSLIGVDQSDGIILPHDAIIRGSDLLTGMSVADPILPVIAALIG